MTTGSGESVPPLPEQRQDDPSHPGAAASGQTGDPSQPAAITPEWVGFAMQFVESAARTPSMTDAIASNLTPEHVAEIIAQKDRESERENDDRKESRRLSFVLVIVAILSVVAIIIFLTIYKEGDLLGYILSGIGGLIAGAFGGYGYANRSR